MNDAAGVDGLSVGEVARRLGVTVRALHHWDQIGLACPSLRTRAGYRLYTAEDLQRLHRIVVYREIGLGLEQIRSVLDDSSVDVPAELRLQRAQLGEQIRRLQQLSAGLDRMIAAHEHGVLLSAQQQTEIFGPQWNPQSPAEARQRYGDTTQWRQFAERAASRNPEDWQAITETMTDLEHDLAEAMNAGIKPGSSEANELVEEHREVFSSYFPLTRQMQVCLGRMFEADPGYAAYYNDIRAGLATWFRQSIDANARAHSIDPDAATWQ